MKYCSFIGAETLSDKSENRHRHGIEKAIEIVLSEGVHNFIYMHGAGFELLAFEILMEKKKHHPEISILLSSLPELWEGNINPKFRHRVQHIKNNSICHLSK